MSVIERAKAIWNLFTSGNMSKADKWILVLALLYCLSPVDVVPDVVPFFGFLDDLLIVLASLRHFSKKAVPEDEAVHVEAKVGNG